MEGVANGVSRDVKGDFLDDNVSIIRLLRVFLGATVKDDEGDDDDDDADPPRAVASSNSNSTSTSGTLAAAVEVTAAAREHAGCTLWDLSAEEERASAMCAAGLLAVSRAVLGDCVAAKAKAEARERGDADAEKKGGNGGSVAAASSAAGGGGGVQEAERLREVACGLLANVCSHRSLRSQVAGDPLLGEELLRAFHDSDDPAPLTELLRLFATAALTATTAVPATASGEEAATAVVGQEATRGRAGGLASGLAEMATLEKLAFVLENSLEEKLLAWACSLAYALMYGYGDAVIRPLVEGYGLEESLTALLNTRSTDLSYEKLGGTETGLDKLLRCLEVLSTSEASSLGPSPPAVTVAAPPSEIVPQAEVTMVAAATPMVAVAAEDAVMARVGARGAAGAGRDSEQQLPLRRKMTREAGQAQEKGGHNKEEAEAGEEKKEIGYGSRAKRDGIAAADVAESTKATSAATGGPAIRTGAEGQGSVIRGLVAALVPWEHSRRTQRAALLVLGNVLGNALEGDAEAGSEGVQGKEGGGGAGSALEACAAELDRGLAVWAADGGWAGEGEAAGVGKLMDKQRIFKEAVHKLVGGDDSKAEGDEDGLREELEETAKTINRFLQIHPGG